MHKNSCNTIESQNLKIRASAATTWDAYEHFRVLNIILFQSCQEDYLLADCCFVDIFIDFATLQTLRKILDPGYFVIC